MNSIRQQPTLFGLLCGPLLLTALRWLTHQIGIAVAPNITEGLSSGQMYVSSLSLFLHSLFIGGVLGGLSANVGVGWWDKDLARMQSAMTYARLTLLLLLAWTGLQMLVTLKVLRSLSLTAFELSSSDVPWQVYWAFFSLFTNIPLLWAIGLTVVGTLLRRRLRRELERAPG